MESSTSPSPSSREGRSAMSPPRPKMTSRRSRGWCTSGLLRSDERQVLGVVVGDADEGPELAARAARLDLDAQRGRQRRAGREQLADVADLEERRLEHQRPVVLEVPRQDDVSLSQERVRGLVEHADRKSVRVGKEWWWRLAPDELNK